jgi:protein tyrosine/serine phosphatase
MPIEQVIADVLYRSERPGYPSDRVGETEVAAWCERANALKIKTIICLLDERGLAHYAELPGGLLDRYGRAGFRVLHHPVQDHQEPPVPNAIIARIQRDFQAAEKPVLVHCSAGVDRTGAVVAALRRDSA